MWNTIHKRIVKTDVGLEASVNIVKLRTKTILLECQAVEDKDNWTDNNFQISTTPQNSSSLLASNSHSSNPSSDVIDVVTL